MKIKAGASKGSQEAWIQVNDSKWELIGHFKKAQLKKLIASLQKALEKMEA